MFCNQCEQTMEGGCDKKIGICGKNEDISSLQDIAIFGLKGVAAYAHHARELGATNSEVDSIMADTLYSTLTNVNFRLNDNVDTVLKVGEATMKVMDLLDKAHTDKLGIPEPVTVSEDKWGGVGESVVEKYAEEHKFEKVNLKEVVHIATDIPDRKYCFL